MSKELAKPFSQPSNTNLWAEELSLAKPSKLFLLLLDFSVDSHGAPGPDMQTNNLYVVTALAQYSLKDYFEFTHNQENTLPN